MHFNNGTGIINLDHVKITVIPLGMAGFLPHPHVPEIYNVEEDQLGTNSEVDIKFYVPLVKCKGTKFINFKSTALLFQNSKNPSAYLGLKQISTNIPNCIFVHKKVIIFNNKTSKVHSSNKNVGKKKKVDANMTAVVDSMKNIRCLECKTSKKIRLHPPKSFDKPKECTICNYVTKSDCMLDAHERIHLQQIPFLCPECGVQFSNYNNLVSHLHYVCFHFYKQIRYKCDLKKCNRMFSDMRNYKIHLHIHMSRKVYGCTICDKKLFVAETMKSHMRKNHESDAAPVLLHLCSLCKKYVNKGHGKEHNTRPSTIFVNVCKNCDSHFKTVTQFAQHFEECKYKQLGSKHTMVNNECPSCKTVYKLSNNSTFKGCPKCDASWKRVCILCKEMLDSDKLDEHLISKKCPYIQPYVKIQRLSQAQLDKYLKDDADVSRKRKAADSDKSPSGLKKKKVAEEEVQVAENAQINDNAVDPLTLAYNCSQCQFSHDSRNEFHEHILRHRYISTAYQCMECGECFVVKPSLAKHLLHCHQIEDIDTYTKVNNCFDEDAIKELNLHYPFEMGNVQVKDNQCRVCLKEFDNSMALNKHFRVHGMAFLMHNSK